MSLLFSAPDPFEPPSLSYLFLSSPPKFLLRLIHGALLFLRVQPTVCPTTSVRVVCLSDTHCKKPSSVPHGDLLVHAGDLTNAGTPAEIQDQIDWLNSLPHDKIVVIAGNHDTYLDPRSRKELPDSELNHKPLSWGRIQYLQHSSVVLDFKHRGERRLRIYGAPQIPACGGPEFAFQYPRGSDAWTGTIPADTDILVTHTPPKYHMDLPAGLGCEFLLKETWRVQAPLHIFGHVHAGRGREIAYWDKSQQAFERGCARPDGFIRSTLDVILWFRIIEMTWHDVTSLIWERIWGGEGRATQLVNSSLMYINTGRLENPPQVIDV